MIYIHTFSLALAVVLTRGLGAKEIDWGCDPLVPDSCMLPFPNDYWRISDGNGNGGHRLNMSLTTFPVDRNGQPIDPDKGGWNDLAGFSPFQAFHAYFPGTDDISIDNCARWWNIEFSLSDESPTIVLDTVTGQRVAHWVELDYTSVGEDVEGDPAEARGAKAGYEWTNKDKHALLIWPAGRLENDRRYIVGIKHLPSRNGGQLPTSSAFRSLRDGLPSTDPRVTSRRAHFESIFTSLQTAGVQREDLLLAWDFTTNTRDNIVSRMISARDDARARLGNDGPEYKIRQVEDNINDHIRRKITGDFRVPMYLTSHLPTPDVRLVVDEEGNAVFQGYAWFRFEVLIPNSLANNKTPGRILQYGHGLFGNLGEVEAGYLGEEADKYGYVLCASTWLGLSSQDVPAAVEMIVNDLTDFMYIPDRTTQGMVNALSLMQMLRGSFSQDENVVFDGVSVIDTTKTAYFGNSEGGIFGAVYMAVTQDVEYGCLGVPGGPYSLLLPRSHDFMIEFAAIKYRYPDPLDRINIMQVMQLLWDRAEPSGYMDGINKEPFPNTPAHQVLLHYGLGDAQVTWLGAQAIARSASSIMYESNVPERDEKFYGYTFLKDTDVVYGRSGIVGWQFDAPPVPIVNIPPNEEFDTHEDPRRDLRAQEQMNLFFEEHKIINTCEGPCTI